ncbi:hypothetical protein [Rhodococcoides kyotonense]|uniref:Uncharacterized protein n=1 Tax=Rhodococcoides kyotonense TaxID=398843 RepID=A0A239MZW2_9NOCA|nr:hypothetical protein [Rhodococcus kyotonensis]SNT47419.1 hypothetical protein SAMN05421642_12450 [Rhodococcus kyotonensis]
MVDVDDLIDWPDRPDREAWWRSVLGLDTSTAELGHTSLIAPASPALFDNTSHRDDLHPYSPADSVAA